MKEKEEKIDWNRTIFSFVVIMLLALNFGMDLGFRHNIKELLEGKHDVDISVKDHIERIYSNEGNLLIRLERLENKHDSSINEWNESTAETIFINSTKVQKE